MSDSGSRTRSFYASVELLAKVEAERDRLANGDLRRRPSFNKTVVSLLEKALAASPPAC